MTNIQAGRLWVWLISIGILSAIIGVIFEIIILFLIAFIFTGASLFISILGLFGVYKD